MLHPLQYYPGGMWLGYRDQTDRAALSSLGLKVRAFRDPANYEFLEFHGSCGAWFIELPLADDTKTDLLTHMLTVTPRQGSH